MKILIIDDERQLAEALQEILNRQKFCADAVFDGDSGLDYALSGRYEYVYCLCYFFFYSCCINVCLDFCFQTFSLLVNNTFKRQHSPDTVFLDNAVKYSDEGGKILVSLTRQGEKNVLEVFNTGAGILESEKQKIFDRFYRSDYSRTRETGGQRTWAVHIKIFG